MTNTVPPFTYRNLGRSTVTLLQSMAYPLVYASGNNNASDDPVQFRWGLGRFMAGVVTWNSLGLDTGESKAPVCGGNQHEKLIQINSIP